MGNWYVGKRSAEGNAYFVIELTDEERKAVQKFIDAQDNMYDEGYSGYFQILDSGPFDTKRKAVEWVIKESFASYEWRGLSQEKIEEVINSYIDGGN